MRIAVTTGLLPVPPTYFVVQHALELAAVHDFAVFARAARVGDPDLGMAIDSVVPARGRGACGSRFSRGGSTRGASGHGGPTSCTSISRPGRTAR